MNALSLENFAKKYSQQMDILESFQLENENILKVDLEGAVWIKMGTMISYTEDVRFKRETNNSHRAFHFFKKTPNQHRVQLTKAYGMGELFLADKGKRVSILKLENNSIFINGNNILAFDACLDWDIGTITGGSSNIKLSGTGFVAVSTYFNPLVLKIIKGRPVITDPEATVLWSENIYPEVKLDVSIGTIVGKSHGETVQLKFEGDGFVAVQSFEEDGSKISKKTVK